MEIATFEKDDRPWHLPGWTLTGAIHFDELVEFREEQQLAHPGHRLLFILDDPSQARYTSMHACETHDLIAPDETNMSEAEIADFEESYSLTPERWAQTVGPRLQTLAAGVDLADLAGQLLPIDASEVELLANYEAAPEALQSPLTCLRLPAEHPSLAIAALPNGYFSDDLSPAENYALAELLHEKFGYEIVGLGAFLAAYVRPEPLSRIQAEAVVESVGFLYNDFTPDHARALVDAIFEKRWLVLSYRGS